MEQKNNKVKNNIKIKKINMTKKNKVIKDNNENIEPETEPDIRLGYGYEDVKYTEDLEIGNPIFNITFTINNYTDKHIEFFKMQEYKYLIMYGEIGKKNNTPHIQGFISLDIKKKKRISTLSRQLKKFAGSGAWMALSKGTPLENKIYCEKEGTKLFEDGNIKLCGKGSQERKLQDIQALIDDGMTMEQIAKENFNLYIQYGKRFEAYKELIEDKDRDEYTEAYYVHGKTGTGKTTNFIQKMKEYDKWNKVDFVEYDGKYYGNYNNKPVAVFDDDYKLEDKDILNLVNIKPWKMRMLGKYKSFNSKYVIIIDNRSIDERFGTSLIHNGQLQLVKEADERIKRRFKVINYDTDEGKLAYEEMLKII